MSPAPVRPRRRAWPWWVCAPVPPLGLPLLWHLVLRDDAWLCLPIAAGIALFVVLMRRGMQAWLPGADDLWSTDPRRGGGPPG